MSLLVGPSKVFGSYPISSNDSHASGALGERGGFVVKMMVKGHNSFGGRLIDNGATFDV